MPRKTAAKPQRKPTPGPIDPDWLQREYVEAGRSTADIARELGCARETAAKALRDAGIELRPAHVYSRPGGGPRRPRPSGDPVAARRAAEARMTETMRSRAPYVAARAEQVEAARRVLAGGVVGETELTRRVLMARVEFPDDSIGSLAARVGLSRGALAGTLWKVLNREDRDTG